MPVCVLPVVSDSVKVTLLVRIMRGNYVRVLADVLPSADETPNNPTSVLGLLGPEFRPSGSHCTQLTPFMLILDTSMVLVN